MATNPIKYNYQPQSIAAEDFNNDSWLDIVVTNIYGSTISVFLRYGNGSFADQIEYSSGPYSLSVEVGDFNNDTRLDIVVANSDDDNVGALLGYGNVADFNNDTVLDIIVGNYGTSKIVVLFGNGNGIFKDQKEFSLGYGSFLFSVVVGDFNSDKKVDFVVANEGVDSLEIYLQTC